MKILKIKKIKKQIIYIVMFLMLCNFIMPNYSYASLENNDGGDLFVDLAQLLCFVPDVVIETLQHMFVSRQNIYDEETEEYKILYSPGTIFSGSVPAFDINFIKPNTYVSKDSNNQTSVIASNTYSANKSGGVTSSGDNVIYEGTSIIGTSTTHTKGERWNSRSRSKIVRNIWI